MSRLLPVGVVPVLVLVASAGVEGGQRPGFGFQAVANKQPRRRADGRYLVGWLEVFRGDRPAAWQRLPVLMSGPSTEWVRFGHEERDVNFDGHVDVAVFEHGGAKWGRFHWWLFDPASRRFRRTALTAALRRLTFADYRLLPSRRQLILIRFHGARLDEYRYRITGDRLHLLKITRGVRWTGRAS
jgi:hypothetical protein